MRAFHLLLVCLLSPCCSGLPITYWVDSSCQDPKFNGGFEAALSDALFSAQRAFGRLDAPVSPYMDEVFQLLFRKPKSDADTLNRVKYAFNIIANKLVRTDNQVSSDIRFYCDDDAINEGAETRYRWTLTPDEDMDPPGVKNSLLPRLLPQGADPETTLLQQWQDNINWVRMSRGSMGCKDKRATAAETQFRKFSAEKTPSDINPNRVTITICDHRLLNTELTGNEVHTGTSFGFFDGDFAKKTPQIDNSMTFMGFLVSSDILHELFHIDQDGFRTNDPAYAWEAAIAASAEDAVNNAESYAFYAYISRCADKGYRLKMDEIEKGNMIYDQDLERIGGEQDKPS